MDITVHYYQFNPNCRLGNQLYFTLNSYLLNKYQSTHNFYHLITNELNDTLYKKLGIQSDIITTIPKGIQCDYRMVNRTNMLHLCQIFGVNYSEEDLNEFIKNNINIDLLDLNYDTVCLQIRAKDYLTHQADYIFNFNKFFDTALDEMKRNGLNKIHVFSDDIEYCKNTYRKRLEDFGIVEYINNVDPAVDLIKSAKYKNKIIWNSTFAYWSAYISNFIFKNNFQNIFVPDYHCNQENGKAWQLNPKWNIITDLK